MSRVYSFTVEYVACYLMKKTLGLVHLLRKMPKPTRMMMTKLKMERRSDQPPGHRSSWHSCIPPTHHRPLQTARRKMRPALRGRQGQLRDISAHFFDTEYMSVFRALAVLCLPEVPDQRRDVEVVEWHVCSF